MNAVLAAFLGWTLDSFDFFVLTFVISDIAHTFGKSRSDIALTITLALVTRPIGAVLFGMMADRIGRRIPLMINILAYSALTVASGLSPNFATFLVMRILFGVALGGQWGVAASLALESVSVERRGLVSGFLQEGYAFGNLLAAVAYREIYPVFGWRSLFFLGGLPALLSLFVLLKVEDSPVWREHRTDWQTYATTIFSHWRRFLYLVLLMAIIGLMAHGTQDMYPTFLQQARKFTATQTADITIVSMIGACLGGLAVGWLSDRLGRKRAMVIASLCGLLMVPFWIGAPTTALIVIAVFLMQFFIQGAAGVMPAQMNELSPGHLRGLFPGLAYQFGIVAASGITYLEAVLSEHLPFAQAMGFLVAGIFVTGAIVFALGPENKGVSFSAAKPVEQLR